MFQNIFWKQYICNRLAHHDTVLCHLQKFTIVQSTVLVFYTMFVHVLMLSHDYQFASLSCAWICCSCGPSVLNQDSTLQLLLASFRIPINPHTCMV